jgi:hypothetical protein
MAQTSQHKSESAKDISKGTQIRKDYTFRKVNQDIAILYSVAILSCVTYQHEKRQYHRLSFLGATAANIYWRF